MKREYPFIALGLLFIIFQASCGSCGGSKISGNSDNNAGIKIQTPLVDDNYPRCTNTALVSISGKKMSSTGILVNDEELLTVNESSVWQITAELKSEGYNELAISAKDSSGNTSEKLFLGIQLLTQKPNPPKLDKGYAYWKRMPDTGTWIGASESSSVPMKVSYDQDTTLYLNGKEVASCEGEQACIWEEKVTLSQTSGEAKQFRFTSKDCAGNESDVTEAKIYFGDAGLIPPEIFPIHSPTNINTQKISGNKDPTTGILLNGKEIIPINAEQTFEYIVNLEKEGTNVFQFQSFNTELESKVVNITIVLDTTPPVAPKIDLYPQVVNENVFQLSGTGEKGTTLKVNNISDSVLQTAAWSVFVNMVPGENQFHFTLVDPAENESQAAIAKIYYDNEVPVISVDKTLDGKWIQDSVQILVTADDNYKLDTVEHRINAGAWQKLSKTATEYQLQIDSTAYLDGDVLKIEFRSIDIAANESQHENLVLKVMNGPIVISSDPKNNKSETASIHVDDNDNAYVVWVDDGDILCSGNDPDIFLRVDDASGISDTYLVSFTSENTSANCGYTHEKDGDSFNPQVVIDNGGLLHIFWEEGGAYGGNGHDIVHRSFDPTTKKFSAIDVVSEGDGQSSFPQLVINETRNKIHIVWQDTVLDFQGDIFYSTYTSSSAEFSIPLLLSDDPAINDKCERPSVAIDTDDTVHVIWQDKGNTFLQMATETSSTAKYGIHHRFYDPATKEWSSQTMITQSQDGYRGNSYTPKITSNHAKGVSSVFIVWMNEEYTSVNYLERNIYGRELQIKKDGSPHYLGPLMNVINETKPSLSDNINDRFAENPDVAIDYQGNIFVIWHSSGDILNSGTDRDIWMRAYYAVSKPGMFAAQILEWSDYISISDAWNNNDGESALAKIVTDFNGNIHIVWEDFSDIINNGNDKDIFYYILRH